MSTALERPAVVRLEGVEKRFRSWDRLRGTGSLKSALVGIARPRRVQRELDTVQILRDVDLEVRMGDCLAILGANGSGKSTLLKMVAGIYRPDAGRVMTRGRVASLLELGTGFHPDFSGVENVFINASILGLSDAEIRERLPSIVEFSGLGSKVQAPVRTYSSGMYVRLGFSVAIHVMPDVLLIDEVLAVGDQEFRRRCLGKIHELRDGGATILFVSHEIGLVEALASRAVVCAEGRVIEHERVKDAIAAYAAPPAAPPAEARA